MSSHVATKINRLSEAPRKKHQNGLFFANLHSVSAFCSFSSHHTTGHSLVILYLGRVWNPAARHEPKE